MELKQLGWKVPIEVKDGFMEYCDKLGMDYQVAVASAMALWPHVPPEIQRIAELEAASLSKVDAGFWKEYAEGLRLGLLGHADTHAEKPKRK